VLVRDYEIGAFNLCSGFGVYGLETRNRVQGLGSRIYGPGYMIYDSGCRVKVMDHGVYTRGLMVSGKGFMGSSSQGQGIGGIGLGFRV